MANLFGSLVTPQTELLLASMRGIDSNRADLERVGGMAIQESRNDLARRRQEIIRRMGRYLGSSNDINDMLGSVETQQKGEEDSVSQDLIDRKAAAERMRYQMAQVAPILRNQEYWKAGKDLLGTAAEIGGMFIPGVGPVVSAAGAALKGGDAGDALTGAQGYQEWRDRMRARGRNPSASSSNDLLGSEVNPVE